ncbi:glycosyltransferase family 9 protein [Noviherbaspirillum cavernae]|uniref:Glycosyltransferase family 9 protein n=2 Tax=Noviherbaspirillum cavernae TaxID=2320862 RepID=A0A418X6R0_9BURK|nr:glycosyltransferase family 9 protein [Noviherbaspirillum cavernae]
MLCAVPALRALRAAAPHSHITLIGMPWAAAFVQRFGIYLDDLLAFPGFPAFPEQQAQPALMPSFLQEAQRREFDLVIQMHGSGNLSNPLAMLFGAKRVAGFYRMDQYCPDFESFIPWLDGEHEVRRFVRLMAFLGVPPQGESLEFPLSATDEAALCRCGTVVPAPGSYVCVHPGARLPSRRWLPQRFAAVADRLAESGLQVVLTGSGDEHEIVQAVRGAMRAPAIDLCGKTSLGAVAALLAQARLVVCNDTGISHIAAALATPSVVVCCGSDPRRWAPLDHERHTLVGAAADCRPCMHQVCPIGHPCAHHVSVESVHAATVRLLDASQSGLPSAHAAGVCS